MLSSMKKIHARRSGGLSEIAEERQDREHDRDRRRLVHEGDQNDDGLVLRLREVSWLVATTRPRAWFRLPLVRGHAPTHELTV